MQSESGLMDRLLLSSAFFNKPAVRLQAQTFPDAATPIGKILQ